MSYAILALTIELKSTSKSCTEAVQDSVQDFAQDRITSKKACKFGQTWKSGGFVKSIPAIISGCLWAPVLIAHYEKKHTLGCHKLIFVVYLCKKKFQTKSHSKP